MLRNFVRTGAVLAPIMAVIAFAISGCPQPSNPNVTYSLVRITPKGYSGFAAAINAKGDVVGYVGADPPQQSEAYLWSTSQTPYLKRIGTLGGDSSYANGINDYREVVGQARNVDGEYFAFLWTKADGMVPISSDDAIGYDINNKSEVVGVAFMYPGGQAFKWTAEDGMSPLTTDFDTSCAYAINEASRAVGATYIGFVLTGGYYWNLDGSQHAIPNTIGGTGVSPNDINLTGSIVGYAENAQKLKHAFHWTSSGGMVELPSLGSCGPDTGEHLYSRLCSEAEAINAHGEIVGGSYDATEEYGQGVHAVRWKDGKIHDLNDAIPPNSPWVSLVRARDINVNGCIVGDGNIDDGIGVIFAGFLLIPAVIQTLTLPSDNVVAGDPIVGTIKIDQDAPMDIDVDIRFRGLSNVVRSKKITARIRQGARSAEFSMDTVATDTDQHGRVVASFGGYTLSTPVRVVNR